MREVSVPAVCPVEIRYKCPCQRRLSEPFEVVRAQGARSSDPDTSALAALKQQPRSGSQRARILDAVLIHGAMTAREIGEVTGINGAWKRISELVQGEHLEVRRVVRDPKTGTEVAEYGVPDARSPSWVTHESQLF